MTGGLGAVGAMWLCVIGKTLKGTKPRKGWTRCLLVGSPTGKPDIHGGAWVKLCRGAKA